jgi:hypothetical protein
MGAMPTTGVAPPALVTGVWSGKGATSVRPYVRQSGQLSESKGGLRDDQRARRWGKDTEMPFVPAQASPRWMSLMIAPFIPVPSCNDVPVNIVRRELHQSRSLDVVQRANPASAQLESGICHTIPESVTR